MGVLVTKEIAEEAAVIFDVGIDRGRKAVGIDAIAVGIVELYIPRIVNQESIRSIRVWRTANHNPIHGVGLMVGTLLVTVLFVMEITKREQGNPSLLIVANSVDKKER